ncbi:Carboxypeptidase regulatory-like domain-containing protein [Sphingomonas guangdongensis]|uniref:Carboxypeptidase regulatory-like domain-containing protein n=1 Tax=Sphingomonas guangdongensis TaxID=1141890 RepID=A0A285QY84_9SPHN|nr:TonB-dependent receptor [Sphingomonas guangdongensis]SOB86514.1 Carboxypeptidase regulatory-like domain-containing protein [Sphingomonas guangdongensis]
MRTAFFGGVALVALIAPIHAMAQETTSTIRGNVTSGGAPVAGAEVVVTHVPSGTRSTTTTTADGSFSASGLRVGGPFSVEVTSASGNATVSDILTTVGNDYVLPVELADAGSTDIVVTASSISGAGVTSDGPQTVLTARDISLVASVNRDVRDLARRDPFATLDLSNSRAVSFAGVNPRFNRFTINGVQVGDNFGLNSDANPTGRGPIPYDAIGQFSVSIAPYDIREGNFAGGSLNTVMKSGTNDFTGTGFYSLSTSDTQGKEIGSTRITLPEYRSETYGATLSGPIIRDKLFFMVSAERNTDPRPLSVADPALIPGFSPTTLSTIQGIANSARYGNYATGDFVSINDQKDEKIVGKIDWNIMDGQRLSVSYINAFETSTVANGTSTSATTPIASLASNYYTRSNLLRAGIVQLNSDWTDRLSTEARVLYRWTRVGQDSLLGTGYPQIRVCGDATSAGSTSQCSTGVTNYQFGPDNSRQTNQLFYDQWGGSFLARYEAGSHELRMFVEYNENRTYNLFLQNTAGFLYFDSVADFQSGTAGAYNLQVPVNGDINSVAADFKYGQYTFGFSDDWRVTDRLTITTGFRYDLFGQRDAPVFNQFFLQRFNFPNTQTYKGLDNFQPRVSFNWEATDWARLRGGVGIFGGGSPDIYLSNAFSNTGVLANAFTASTTNFGVIRSANGANTCSTGPAAVCTAVLNNVTTPALPQAAVNFLQTNTASLALSPTVAVAPDIHLPSVLKATFSADVNLFGFNVGGDFYYSDTLHSPAFTDLRGVPVGRLPDGRPRYTSVGGIGDANSDFVFYDETRGRSFLATARFDKQFDWGLSFGGSYTWADVKDVSPATASTAGSLYGQQPAVDPNFPVYGTSNDEIKWAFKYNIGFDHAFFGDYRTAIQLFGETRAGRRYSFTMQDPNGGRSPIFGTVGNNDRYLLYVPTSTTDALVSYDSTTTRDQLEGLINSTELRNFRGQVAPKNIARSRAFTRIDLHAEQEIPTFIGKSRITLWADIENLPNLLNSDWGGLRQLGFPYTSAAVQVACLNAAGAPVSGVIGSPTNPVNGCASYRYSSYRAPTEAVVNTNNSLYLIRVGARFTF